MTDDGALLLAAILADPADDVARLVYADWLQEHEQAERAEFIRVQIELAAMSPGPLACERCGCRLVRQRMSSFPDMTRCSTCRYSHGPFWEDTQNRAARYELLERRQQQLLADPHNFVNWTPSVMHTGSRAGIRYETGGTVGLFGTGWDTATFRRGFIESVACAAADWIQSADGLLAANPIQKVALTTPPYRVTMGLSMNPIVCLLDEHNGWQIPSDSPGALKDLVRRCLRDRFGKIEFTFPPVIATA